MKKETRETAKDTSPKVSSLGQGAKWVKGSVRVSGCAKATAAIYIHPSNPKTNDVRDKARIIFIYLGYSPKTEANLALEQIQRTPNLLLR